jgi:hypothetical protein
MTANGEDFEGSALAGALKAYAPAGRILRAWRSLQRPALRFYRRSIQRWCIARTLYRSLRGHIREQLAIEGKPEVGLGSAYLEDTSGRLQPNMRTYVRILGIQSLNAKYPWASPVDLQIFLSGFDDGERLARDTSLISKWEQTYQKSPCSSSTWLRARPLSEVPEPSKHDRLAPLASRESAC